MTTYCDCMTFVMNRGKASVRVDEFPHPYPHPTLPPEQLEQHRRPLLPFGQVEHGLEGGAAPSPPPGG